MNYTTTKQSVIFELPLSGYLGSRDIYSYDQETKKRTKTGNRYILSIQEKEEDLFDCDLNFWEYTTPNSDDLEDAKTYLKGLPDNYTDQEIEEQGNLESDVRRAMVDAREDSYRTEWINEYLKRTQTSIEVSIADYLDNDFAMLDRLDDEEFKRNKTDQEFLKVEVSKDKIKEYLKSENLTIDADYIDTFIENVFDYLSAKEINIEYIDYYGTMGDTDDWLTYFKDYQETTSAIDNYRKDEADKIDNPERASLELKQQLEDINRYAAKYFTKEETRQKIARQVTALKSVIKNAA